MKQTFADELLQFAKTIDILNEELFKDIKSIINKYAEKRWGVNYVKIMIVYKNNDDKEILKKFLLDEYRRDIFGSKKDIELISNDKPSQMQQVLKSCKPMWIVAEDGGSLNRVNNKVIYKDLWSKTKSDKISKYTQGEEDVDISTSILIPFKGEYGLKGVVDYEIEEYLEYSKDDEDELLTLNKTIEELLTLHYVRKIQEENTNYAINRLKNKLKYYMNTFQENSIFFAFPKKGRDDAITFIKNFINKRYKQIRLISWDENTESGSIKAKLFNDIRRAKYGICYFSEKVDDKNKKQKFIYNNNVIFEAGFMHAKSMIFNHSNPTWMIVSEENHLKELFDINDFNSIIVERDEKHKIKKDVFEKKLGNFLDKIVNIK